MVNLNKVTRRQGRDTLSARLTMINGIRTAPRPIRPASLQNLARSVLPIEREDDHRQGAFSFDLPPAA